MKFFQELNVDQQRAIHSEGIVIIIAGPGTGKTKTLTARIQYLIEEKNINPSQILGLTFTKKAATEMKERLAHLSTIPYISTFHSLALDLLGNSKIIISEKERTILLNQLFESNNKIFTKKDIKDASLAITRYKNKLQNESNSLVEAYNRLLSEKSLLDYDDLLIELHTLLKEKKVLREFSYILVDEFQDTNLLQYNIIKLLLKKNNLFVIGDPLQSIYSFRGADADIVKKIEIDFPQHTKIELSTNYRSDTTIIDASSSLFSNFSNIIPYSKFQGAVFHIETINEYTEAEWIVTKIDSLIGGTDLHKAGINTQEQRSRLSFKDFAIIYRTHSFARILEQKFISSGIPYQIVGDNPVYTSLEAAFILTSIRYVQQGTAELLHDILISKIFGLTKKSIKQLSKLYEKNKNKYIVELEMNTDLYCFSKKDMNLVSTFLLELKNIKNELKSLKITKIIHKLSQLKNIKEYINSKAPNHNNIHTIISVFTQFDSKKNGVEKAIEYWDYLQENEFYDPQVDKVSLMTIHAAKGLEFSEVFIVGVEEGSIPFIRRGEVSLIAEEKRLFYVAMTRAKHNLYLLSAKERGKKKTDRSQFLTHLKSITFIEDEEIEKRLKQLKKWKEKKSQLSLF